LFNSVGQCFPLSHTKMGFGQASALLAARQLLSPSTLPKSHGSKELDPYDAITLTERLERRWRAPMPQEYRRKKQEDKRDVVTTTASNLTHAEAQMLRSRRDLRERDVHTRYAAVDNLARHAKRCTDLQKEPVIKDLCDVLRRDQSALVRKSAVFALGELGADSAVCDLQDAARCDKDQYVRKESLQVLEMMGFFTDMLLPEPDGF